MDKLIFKRPKPRAKTGQKSVVIRITDDAYEILSALSAETGKAVGYVASRMIEFANEHTVIEDEN